MYYFLFKSSKG